MKSKTVWFSFAVALLVFASYVYGRETESLDSTSLITTENSSFDQTEANKAADPHPLSIEYLRSREFPGSELIIEEELASASNYSQYIVSYDSDGLKQYALLTVPTGQAPDAGWPAIVFNHGYIPPDQYRTTERYVAYVDGFASNGYIVLKPDYRGHGDSEGRATGGYGSPAYTIDVLNALSSLKKRSDVDSSNIGMWGHSMGGWITQRAMVTNTDISAGVIWGGVVGSYQDIYTEWWGRRSTTSPRPQPSPGERGYWRYELEQERGTTLQNPTFWDSLSVLPYLEDLSGPIQLHHARGDETVPYRLSELFDENVRAASRESELFLYEGDDHNISANFSTAMLESVNFFDKHLK